MKLSIMCKTGRDITPKEVATDVSASNGETEILNKKRGHTHHVLSMEEKKTNKESHVCFSFHFPITCYFVLGLLKKVKMKIHYFCNVMTFLILTVC